MTGGPTTDLSYEQVKVARHVVNELIGKAWQPYDEEMFAALVEAKRVLGMAVSLWWPEHFADLMDEQG